LEDVLITPVHSITQQVHEHYLPYLFHHDQSDPEFTTKKEIAVRNRLFNTDGFGMAWYSPVRSEFATSSAAGTDGLDEMPVLFKTIQPPNNNANLKSLAANTSTKCVFAHIRMATSVVTEFNNHPFIFGRHCFMHNGTVSEVPKIKRHLQPLMSTVTFENITGTTDSEAVAALYMTFLTSGSEDPSSWLQSYPLAQMKAALEKTVQVIIDTQRKIVPGCGANDLNLATTDGQKMIAIRFRDHKTEQPPSLYWSDTAGVKMNRKYVGHPDHDVANSEVPGTKSPEEHGDHVCVCSEPTTYDAKEWHLIPKNKAVLIENGKVTIDDINVKY